MEIIVNGQAYSSEKEAKKAIAKAAQDEKKAQAVNQANSEKAKAEANANFVKTVQAFAHMRNGYTSHLLIIPQELKKHDGYNVMKYQTENGTAISNHSGYEPVSKLQNVAGWDLAVELVDEHSREVNWLAVGTYKDQVYFVEFPSMFTDDFLKIEVWRKSAA